MTKYYIRLLVYNYDASPRWQRVSHFCESQERASHTAWRLQKLIGLRSSDNRTGKWLDRNHGIYGFVERIEGIYQETTTKLGEER